MSQDENTALAALGALLGYVGAEAATTAPFEHLLWPQRHLSNFSLRDAPAVALLMPMGGPFHKAALETFDIFHRHGLLFASSRRGHMLGTAFFTEIGWTYNVHEAGKMPEIKETRNCLWAPALGLLPVPEINDGKSPEKRAEQGEKKPKPAVRARISVSHLTFSRPTPGDKASSEIPLVREDTRAPSLRIITALVVAESSAIIVAAVVVAVWRTSWALLWLAPLFLRLVSAVFAVHREPLSAPGPDPDPGPSHDYQVHCPRSNGDFMVFTGPPAVVLQFMRHYAHPVRSRARETLQLLVVIALGAVFPLGLVASALFMPLPLQYVWFGYQMFLVVGLHVARYSRRVAAVSTHAAIADALAGSGAILFGHRRNDPETIRVDLAVTYHDRHAEGRLAVERLLNRHKGPEKDLLAPSRSNSEILAKAV
ncbi:hypothetical protein F5X68DRAFT_64041 [Plectosphaerella plurivora]|uniref:Uncharacterized protein n=1 Tax=Plectosphaerella plurivora TaxID=936078 RepID=A0A9P8V177_9PEZI|nr:hypothetical protein F5X68DRAFT_64041 [Plectosphaerella plurivora]